MSPSHNGQVFSADATIGLSLFVVTLVLSITLLNTHMQDKIEIAREERASQIAFQAADFLIRTPGFPSDWDANTVQLIGLADPAYIIQPEKVTQLDTLSYAQIRAHLKTQPYDILINITDPSYSETAGQNWPQSAAIVAQESRTVLIEHTNRTRRGTVEVTVWRDDI